MKPLIYWFGAVSWSAVLYVLAARFATGPLWTALLITLLMSVPVALVAIYLSTVRQIGRLAFFAHRGLLHGLLSGRVIRPAVLVVVSLVSTMLVMVQFHTYDAREWATFFVVVPLFWVVAGAMRRLLARELRPFVATAGAVYWSRHVTAALMVAVHLAIALQLATPPAYASLAEAIAAQQLRVQDMVGSRLLWETSQYLAIYSGFKAYALVRVGGWDLGAVLILALGSYAVYFSACSALGAWRIPAAEYRRMVAALEAVDQAPPASGARIGVLVAVVVFVTGFVFVPLLAGLEASAGRVPAQQLERVDWAQVEVERIGDGLFEVGTLARIDAARATAVAAAGADTTRLRALAEAGFDRMTANVDRFLDWYYSLVGEYSRIGSLLIGDLEQLIERRLLETLGEGDPFGDFGAEIAQLLTDHEAAAQAYAVQVEAILAATRLQPAADGFRIVAERPAIGVPTLPEPQVLVEFRDRLVISGGSSAVAGAITALVTKKVVGKVVAKSVIKASAKALAKVVASKTLASTGGAAGGALAGAAVGSVVPGVGTAIGAAVGGVVGAVVVGVSVDKLLLMLESHYARDTFRAEIIASVDEAESEFMAAMPLPAP